jgi:Fe-S cluster assembly protein SufD
VTLPIKIDIKDVTSFPSKRDEAWKYSDLRRFLRDAPVPSAEFSAETKGPFPIPADREIVFSNGRSDNGGNFANHAAYEDEVLILRFVSNADGTGHQARAIVHVEDANLVVLESYEGQGAGYVSNVGISYDVGPGASLTRIVLAHDVGDAISISIANVAVHQRASFQQVIVTNGAKLQRFETNVRHKGQDAQVRLDGLYQLSGARHADLTSVVDHLGPNGQTSQLTKGVVRDTARGVFQGKIVVERGADGTDARMGHHALILGERAEVDAKPELEIYADDVQCAHGNTVGNLDESALFYMQQRGIPADEARALLTQAFLIEVVDRIAHEGAREVVREWLTARL